MATNTLQPGAAPANADACSTSRRKVLGIFAAAPVAALPIAAMAAPASTRWDTLLAIYQAALDQERAYDAVHVDPVVAGCRTIEERRPALDSISRHIWAESERLQNIRLDAEVQLMDCPSPHASAFLRKFLILNDQTDLAGWDDMLVVEAKRLGGEA